MSKSYRAAKVVVLETVTCAAPPGDDPKTLYKGEVLGNVLGHRGGIRVTEHDDGTVSLRLHTEFTETWNRVPSAALNIEKSTLV